MQVQAKSAPPAAKPAASPATKGRNCPTCMGPLGEDVSRCNRCGKQISGGRKPISVVGSKARQLCPICSKDRVMKSVSFGILPKNNSLSLLELETTACTFCVQKSEQMDMTAVNIMKGAMLMLGLGGFSLFQWMCAEEGAGIYTLGIVGFTILAMILALISRNQHQSSIAYLVSNHPRVMDLKSKGGITLMSQKDLKKMSS